MKTIEFKALVTPEGLYISFDTKTGKPTRLVLDGVTFTPTDVPERESWANWPQLNRNGSRLYMDFAPERPRTRQKPPANT